LGAIVTAWWLYKDRALIALAKNVYWESVSAREPELSSRIVAHVTVLRAKHNRPYWGGIGVDDVGHRRGISSSGREVCQFSWTCTSAAKKEPAVLMKWQEALQIAKDELSGTFKVP